METTTSDALADLDAIMKGLGKPQDPELVKRVEERSREIRERVLKEHGVLNVVSDLVREAREE